MHFALVFIPSISSVEKALEKTKFTQIGTILLEAVSDVLGLVSGNSQLFHCVAKTHYPCFVQIYTGTCCIFWNLYQCQFTFTKLS